MKKKITHSLKHKKTSSSPTKQSKIIHTRHHHEWIKRAVSFMGIMVLLLGFGIFCWMVKEMARVGVLGISISP